MSLSENAKCEKNLDFLEEQHAVKMSYRAWLAALGKGEPGLDEIRVMLKEHFNAVKADNVNCVESFHTVCGVSICTTTNRAENLTLVAVI